MTTLFIQLLRIVQTPETEIATLVALAGKTKPPLELIRELSKLQLDVITELSNNRNCQCFEVNRDKITSIWRKYMNDDNATLKGEKKTSFDVASKCVNTSASGTTRPTKSPSPLSDLNSSSSTDTESTVESKVQVVTGNGTDTSIPVLPTPASAPVSKCTYTLTSQSPFTPISPFLTDTSLTLCYQLFRKLATPEWIVDSLLAEDATHPAELMSKLADIEREIASVPTTSDSEQLLATYRTQVVSLWSEHYQQPADKPVTVPKATSSPQSTTKQENAKKSLAPSSMSSHPKALTNGAGGHNFTKAGTCAHIAKNFAHIRKITSTEQVDDLKELVTQVAKSLKTIGPFKKDDSVQERAVGIILPKLPAQMRVAFNDRIERGIYLANLRNLKLFLAEEIANIYANRSTVTSEMSDSGVSSTDVLPPETLPTKMPQNKPPVYLTQPNGQSSLPSLSPHNNNSHPLASNQEVAPVIVKSSLNGKKDGQEITAGLENITIMCYKCQTAGHNTRYCRVQPGSQNAGATLHQERLSSVLTQLSLLLERLSPIPPEEIDLRKLLQLLERVDMISKPMWRNEEVQKLALGFVLPKLSPSVRARFFSRCRNADKPPTIRELKCFIGAELRSPFRVISPVDMPAHGAYGLGVAASTNNAAGGLLQSEPIELGGGLVWCTKCSSRGHHAEQCIIMLQTLDQGPSI